MKAYLLTKEEFVVDSPSHRITIEIFSKEEMAKQFLRDEIAEAKKKCEKFELIEQTEYSAIYRIYKNGETKETVLCCAEKFVIE